MKQGVPHECTGTAAFPTHYMTVAGAYVMQKQAMLSLALSTVTRAIILF